MAFETLAGCLPSRQASPGRWPPQDGMNNSCHTWHEPVGPFGVATGRLIVTPLGLPLAYEVLPGNTVDNCESRVSYPLTASEALCAQYESGRLHAFFKGLLYQSAIPPSSAVH